MSAVKSFCFPATAAEALKVMGKSGSNAVVIAGGTRLARSLPADASCVVDIRNLRLKHIKADSKWLYIGSLCTFTQLENSSLLKKWAGGIIAGAAARGSSRLMRNMATVGGNIVRAYPFNNLPPVFLALDAQAVVADRKGSSTVPFSRLYEKEFINSLGRKALLTEVKIPSYTKNWAGVFVKLSKAETDWESYIDAAVAVEMKGKKCSRARIVLGAVTLRAARFAGAEKLVEGREITAAAAEEAAKAVREELDGILTVPALKEYRRQAAPALVKRCLLEAARTGAGL